MLVQYHHNDDEMLQLNIHYSMHDISNANFALMNRTIDLINVDNKFYHATIFASQQIMTDQCAVEDVYPHIFQNIYLALQHSDILKNK